MSTAVIAPVNPMSAEGKDTVMTVMRRDREKFTRMVSDPKNWNVDTRCTGWQTRDLVGHMIDVMEGYFKNWDAAVAGKDGTALGLPVMGETLNDHALEFRKLSREEALDRFKKDAQRLDKILNDLTPEQWTSFLVYHPFAGPVPAGFYGTFQIMDYGVHPYDIEFGLVDRGELVAEPVLDVVRVNSLVPYSECVVEAGRYWTRERVIDEKARPLLRRQVVEDLVELLRILLEAVERLLARELAELESVVVEGLPHHRQAKRRSVFARHRRVPVLEVALHHVDHVADQVACLPAGAARVDVPVLRVGDHPRELLAVSAHDGHDRVLAFGRHR